MKLAVLLHGSVENDYRVIKTIETISTEVEEIWVFHVENPLVNRSVFDNNPRIRLVNCIRQPTLYQKIMAHSFFCFEYLALVKAVVQTSETFDIIWANDLPTLLPAHRLKKRFKAKLIYDAHEIYTETINQFFPRNTKGIKILIFNTMIFIMRFHGKLCERRLIMKADQFLTVNESLLAYFRDEYGLPKGHVIMNLPRLSDTAEKTTPYNFRLSFNWAEHHTILLYQGALNEGRGLRLLIEAVQRMPKEYCLVIIGNGVLKQKLQKDVAEKGLGDRIKFIDAVKLIELPNYTSGADIGVNLLEDFNLSKKLASPNKLFEYIHSGIPVLASSTIENNRVMERFKIGESCNNTVESITEAIFKIGANKYTAELTAAKKYYNWEGQEASLLNIIND
jgi:glycosyltransferase involved in cell wall biosynthesis